MFSIYYLCCRPIRIYTKSRKKILTVVLDTYIYIYVNPSFLLLFTIIIIIIFNNLVIYAHYIVVKMFKNAVLFTL